MSRPPQESTGRRSVREILPAVLALPLLAYFAFWACGVTGEQLLTSTTSTTAAAAPFFTTTGYIVYNEQYAERYLRENDASIRQDLARGAGPRIDELAQMYSIRPVDRAAFGRQLRIRRGELLELLEPQKLNGARAQMFFLRAQRCAGDLPHAPVFDEQGRPLHREPLQRRSPRKSEG